MKILWLRGALTPVNNIAWHQQAGGLAPHTPQQTHKVIIVQLNITTYYHAIFYWWQVNEPDPFHVFSNKNDKLSIKWTPQKYNMLGQTYAL